jgi:hypothetical protein
MEHVRSLKSELAKLTGSTAGSAMPNPAILHAFPSLLLLVLLCL